MSTKEQEIKQLQDQVAELTKDLEIYKLKEERDNLKKQLETSKPRPVNEQQFNIPNYNDYQQRQVIQQPPARGVPVPYNYSQLNNIWNGIAQPAVHYTQQPVLRQNPYGVWQ